MRTMIGVTLLAVLVLTVPAGHAQDVRFIGEIAATVRALDGPTIPGVTVTLLRADRTVLQTVITPKNGRVRFPDLPSGDYFVKCEMHGFFGTTIGPIQVRHGANAPELPPLDIRLNPGPVYHAKTPPAT